MTSLNRALDQALTSAWTTDSRLWVPAVDVVEKKDAYKAQAAQARRIEIKAPTQGVLT